MSIGKRLLDLARANVNALLNRTNAELEDFSDAELDAELRQRQARRQREEKSRREREAAERAARQRSRQPRSAAAGSSTTPVEKRRIEALYAQLQTPMGAELDVVKSNFRRLMRQHHPDLHGGSVEAQRAATEITKKLNAAYNELERHLARPST